MEPIHQSYQDRLLYYARHYGEKALYYGGATATQIYNHWQNIAFGSLALSYAQKKQLSGFGSTVFSWLQYRQLEKTLSKPGVEQQAINQNAALNGLDDALTSLENRIRSENNHSELEKVTEVSALISEANHGMRQITTELTLMIKYDPVCSALEALSDPIKGLIKRVALENNKHNISIISNYLNQS